MDATALIIACQDGHEQIARALIEAGATVNHANFRRVTALNLACDDRHEACALLLLQAGARHDVEDDWGDTPLTIAQKRGLDKVLAFMNS